MTTKRNNARILNWVDWTAWVLIILGALNWGLVGLFEFDLVGAIFGGILSPAGRTIFTIVGIAGLWSIYTLFKLASKMSGSGTSVYNESSKSGDEEKSKSDEEDQDKAS